MIRYIKRSDIDEQKYNSCIENALNTRIYAYSWYLDSIADNWGVLVLNDYEAVMPLPWRSKYFIKYVYPPAWTQQLGVFSSNEINNKLIQQFINSIPRKFKKVTIQFNSGNPIAEKNVTERVNYVLDLNRPYEELLTSYKYERRRIVKQKKNISISFESYKRIDDIIELFKESKKEIVDISKTDYKKLNKLINFLMTQNKVKVVSSFDDKGEFLGGAFFLLDNKRISYLFSSITKTGREKQSMTFILDSVIKKYANSKIIFDFEGSMIPGIAFFFRSFGAEKETYYLCQKV